MMATVKGNKDKLKIIIECRNLYEYQKLKDWIESANQIVSRCNYNPANKRECDGCGKIVNKNDLKEGEAWGGGGY